MNSKPLGEEVVTVKSSSRIQYVFKQPDKCQFSLSEIRGYLRDASLAGPWRALWCGSFAPVCS